MTSPPANDAPARTATRIPAWGLRLLTVAAAAVAGALVFLIGKPSDGLTVDQGDGLTELTLGSFIGSSAGAALLGWVLLAVLERFAAARALKTWTIVAGVVLVLSLVTPFAVEAAAASRITLVLSHLAVGLVVIAGMRVSSRSAA